MSFQAYLDNIKGKTGKTGEDFKAMAAEKGLTRAKEIVDWLKTDFGLGHGHAMAIVHLIVHEDVLNSGTDEKLDKLFSGKKLAWRKSYDHLVDPVSQFGPDVSFSVGQTYINVLRNGKKFAIFQPSSAERLDIGIKLPGVSAAGRFEEADAWNRMVTHRVRTATPAQIDTELIAWLKKAYEAS